ncbi:NRDE family protein [Spongiimicrobium sp. 3-5]|uniref:NRDE family protein n=1 Tax=Spongiimicrobium sp. 3-5 TaxID=3332596 RepID=UPI00397FB98D
MCTVSFVALDNGQYVITSNRDEHISRHTPVAPVTATHNNLNITYPKDPKSGGTWFAVSENGVIGVLLNGAFRKHRPKGNYEKSRGLVLLEITSNTDPALFLKTADLTQIEPFTLILFSGSVLLEFRWDGNQKHFGELSTKRNYIWSSATLYSNQVMEQRSKLFEEFVTGPEAIDPANIIKFHSNTNEDQENGFVMNRSNTLKTLSITQAVIDTEEIGLRHMDLLMHQQQSVAVALNTMFNQTQ